MKPLITALVLCWVATSADVQAAPESKWTLSAYTGLSIGDQTPPSLSWRGSVQHWRTPSVGLGLEFGRLRWEGEDGTASDLAFEPFQGLAKGGNQLFHLSASLKIRDDGQGSYGETGAAPFIALGAGVYKQDYRGPDPTRYFGEPNVAVRPGWHVAIGAIALQGLAPGVEFRYDWANTSPGPTSYFTASFALHLNR